MVLYSVCCASSEVEAIEKHRSIDLPAIKKALVGKFEITDVDIRQRDAHFLPGTMQSHDDVVDDVTNNIAFNYNSYIQDKKRMRTQEIKIN